MAAHAPLTGKRLRLAKRALQSLQAAEVCDWRPAPGATRGSAVACTPRWSRAPREIVFYDGPSGLLATVVHGGARGQLAIVDPTGGGWVSDLFTLGDPGSNPCPPAPADPRAATARSSGARWCASMQARSVTRMAPDRTDDCLRAAVATVLQVSPQESPGPAAQEPRGRRPRHRRHQRSSRRRSSSGGRRVAGCGLCSTRPCRLTRTAGLDVCLARRTGRLAAQLNALPRRERR